MFEAFSTMHTLQAVYRVSTLLSSTPLVKSRIHACTVASAILLFDIFVFFCLSPPPTPLLLRIGGLVELKG